MAASGPCTITCFFATVIVVAMVIMTLMVHYDSHIKSYKAGLPVDIQSHYDKIVAERSRIYFTGYLIGFALAVALIVFNVYFLKHRMPTSLMVCFAIVISTVFNYFFYILSPKTTYVISLLKTEKQKDDWLKVYKSMQYYYHASFALGAVAVGVFAFAFRGKCN